jgi:hypothetical protein
VTKPIQLPLEDVSASTGVFREARAHTQWAPVMADSDPKVYMLSKADRFSYCPSNFALSEKESESWTAKEICRSTMDVSMIFLRWHSSSIAMEMISA